MWGSFRWSPGESIGETDEWRQTVLRLRIEARDLTYTKTLGQYRAHLLITVATICEPASIQTDSRASLAPHVIQTINACLMSRKCDVLSTDQYVASPRYRG